MIDFINVTKQYGDKKVIKDMSFTVEKGEILGFLGPNGAGKSTTMNMLTGYLAPTKGCIKINGVDLLENPLEAKKHIGYLPEQPPIYMEMVVQDYLTFVAKLKKVDKKKIKSEITRVMKLVQIEDVAGRLIKNMSKGYKQRIGLAGALIGAPSVLILDEPTVGLDPKQIIEIRHLIKDLSKSYTVILSSHILSEISAVCDRVMIINKGEIVVSEKTEDLLHLLAGTSKLLLTVKVNSKPLIAQLKDIEGIKQVTKKKGESGMCEIYLDLQEGIEEVALKEAIFNACVANQAPIMAFKAMDTSLEEIFLQVTGQGRKLGGNKAEESLGKEEDKVC